MVVGFASPLTLQKQMLISLCITSIILLLVERNTCSLYHSRGYIRNISNLTHLIQFNVQATSDARLSCSIILFGPPFSENFKKVFKQEFLALTHVTFRQFFVLF